MSTSNGHFVVSYSKTGALTAAAGVEKIRLPFPAELVAVVASVGTAPTGAALTLDVNKNGTSVFTGANAGLGPVVPIAGTASQVVKAAAGVSAGQNVITPTVNDGAALCSLNGTTDFLTVDVDQIGSTVAGSDLRVELVFIKK